MKSDDEEGKAEGTRQQQASTAVDAVRRVERMTTTHGQATADQMLPYVPGTAPRGVPRTGARPRACG